jgi:hypothetical protein
MEVQGCWRDTSGMQNPVVRNVAMGQVVMLTVAVKGSHIHGLGLQGRLHTCTSMNITEHAACAMDTVARTV